MPGLLRHARRSGEPAHQGREGRVGEVTRSVSPGGFVMRRFGLVALLGSALALASVYADNNLKSGPQVGQEVPGPFHPLNVTGAQAGKKACLYCSNGGNPVAVV